MAQQEWWNVELAGKPDFETAMKRLYAWYDGDILDRAQMTTVMLREHDRLEIVHFVGGG